MKRVIETWAIAGVLALLVRAIWSLLPHALGPWREGSLGPGLIALEVLWIVFMAYSEGYRGFQRGFSPRVVVRARQLSLQPKWYFVLIAPAYAIGLVSARPKRLIVSWSIVVLIAVIVFFVRRVPQPWRGIIDAGVVIGLAWGVAATLYFTVRSLLGRPPECDPEIPSR